MSSDIKKQSIDGYVSEYGTKHNENPMKAIQTAMCKEFIEYADERDTAIYQEEKENTDDNL